MDNAFQPPVGFDEADRRATAYLAKLTLDQKLAMIGGYSRFYIRGFPEHGIPPVFMTDATEGVRVDLRVTDRTTVKPLERSTAFPSPILLAATWNPELARRYAEAVGEECRAAGASFLLGPGVNIYRISQCGRNFEYFGEDPYLASRMAESYVRGMQSTGVAATLKHFACNNTDFYRRQSNSVVDERALHEIYLPAFKAGIEAGAMAVMTAYNRLNGEWCGQNATLITDVLRGELGFRWLVMTDWVSVYDAKKVIESGQDLEMPEGRALAGAKRLVDEGAIEEAQIDRMVRSILRTCIAMGFYDTPQQDESYLATFSAHAAIALDVAREGVVLLKNDGVLPVGDDRSKRVVATGRYLHEIAHGGGSAEVPGFNALALGDALKNELGVRLEIVEMDDREKLAAADLVLLSIGTFDTEGADRPFDLPAGELEAIGGVLDANERCVVIVSAGGGINMSPWIDKARGVIYAWYGGQVGARAVAEIVSGATNPSGKLPMTIERRFEDSPGNGYIPKGKELYIGRLSAGPSGEAYDLVHHNEQFDIEYREGIFVGYRWYEHRRIEPLFPFGHGLSYTSFVYDQLEVSPARFRESDRVEVSFSLRNSGPRDSAETVQLYVEDHESSVPRPVKELKGFRKVFLESGEEQTVTLELDAAAFSFWDPKLRAWHAEPGAFTVHVGASSADIRLSQPVELVG